ncbi:MAG: acyl-CoA dehydrogenase family protein [Caldilineaceae bacterium]
MYSFDMTSEQKMLVETVHRFAVEELRAAYREAEETKDAPGDAVRTGWEIGLLPGSIEADYGGFGEYSALTSALYLEELGWGDVGISLHLLTPSLFATPIALFGSKEQKETYLPRFCDETFPKATAAIIEPVYQFDPADLDTRAEKVSDGFVITGKKTFVPLAADADLFLVYAQENGTTQAFIVPGDAPGVTVGERVKMMGAQALAVYNVDFAEVHVDKKSRLGGLKGIRLRQRLTVSRIALSAHSFGPSAGGLRVCGRLRQGPCDLRRTIAHRQSIAFMLANMRIEIEAAPAHGLEAAYKFDAAEEARPGRGYGPALRRQDGAQSDRQRGAGAGRLQLRRDHPVELWLRNGRGFATWDGLALA